VHQTTGRWKLGFALALATSILWSTLPIALKVAFERVDPQTVTWLRFLVAALVLGAWLIARGALPLPLRLPARAWLLLAISLAGLIGNYLLYAYALAYVSPTVNQTVIQLAPMLLLLGGVALLHERFARLQRLGLALLLIGLLLFFNRRLMEFGAIGSRLSIGVALLALASMVWAAYGLAQKLLMKALGAQQILWVLYVGATLVLWPTTHPAAILQASAAQVVALVYCCLNTLLGYGAFAAALEHWEVSRVGAVLATAPIFTLAAMWLTNRLWPGLVEPEQLNGLAIFGALAVVAGSIVCALGGRVSGERIRTERNGV
jgi:drug/metabolite transporter (DMT)-like permease